MTITSSADAVAARDKAAHKIHLAQAALNTAVELLTALDVWVVGQLNDETVHPLDGEPKPPHP